MAFEHWKPSTFELDDYVLSWPSLKARRPLHLTIGGEERAAERAVAPPTEDDGFRGSWKELGLDPRIVEVLEGQGCRAPFEIQRRIVSALLLCHHIEISAPSSAGVSTAVLASSLHTLPVDASKATTSLLFLTTSPSRARSLYRRLEKLGEPFELRMHCLLDETPLWDNLESLRNSAAPDVVVATLGRCVTLIEHAVLSISDLRLVCLDFAGSELTDRKAAASHHTVSDVRSILRSAEARCQIVVLCSPGYERTALAKYVDDCQQRSMRQNLAALAREEAEKAKLNLANSEPSSATATEVLPGHERRESTASVETTTTKLSEDWRRVIEEFEFKGLKPEDFMAVKAAHEESIRTWASRVNAEIGEGPVVMSPIPVSG